jgi:hypothetical protein
MASLLDYFSDADSLIVAGPEDLGLVLLQLIQSGHSPRVAPSNLEYPLWAANRPEFPHQKRTAVGRVFGEAWQWLQNEGLVMLDLDQPNGWFCLTRKGAALRTQVDREAYR